MRKQGLAALRIGISRRGMALLGIRERLRPHTDILANLRFEASVGKELGEVGSLLDGVVRDAHASGLPTTVVLADDLARYFIVTPPHNATGLRDCKAAVAMRFHTLYGESPDAWGLAADWNVDKPFLACALPKTLLDGVLDVARTHRLTLVEVVPHFISAWNSWSAELKPDAWFGVLHDDMLTLGAIAHQQLVSVRTTLLPTQDQPGHAWIGQHVTREALRIGLQTPVRLQLCGDAGEQWTTSAAGHLACERLGASLSGEGPSIYAADAALALARGH